MAHIWIRMAVPNTTSNTVLLEVDNASDSALNCYTVTAPAAAVYTSAEATANTYFNNDSTNWVDVNVSTANLAAGTYHFKLIGNAADVVVDRMIITQDNTCTPTGTGDNCTPPPDTAAPTGNITSPTSSTQVSGSVPVQVAASDNVAVSGVDIYDGATKLGSATLNSGTTASGTWQYSWNTSSLTANSSHTLTARITDGTNPVTTTAGVTVTIRDTTAPTNVVITAPANNSSQTGSFTATATASDNVGVTKVEFYVNGTLKATATTAPFSQLIPVTGLTAGTTYSLTAKAYDAVNLSATSAATSFTYNPSTGAAAPTVSVTNVSASTIVSTDLSITAGQPNANLNSTTYTVSTLPVDNSGTGIKQVTLQIDSGTVQTLTTGFNFAVNMSSLSCGAHTLKVVVTDNQTTPKTGTSSMTFTAARGVDVNANCTVDLSDYNAVRSNFGAAASGLSNVRIDVNRNGTVDLSDYSAVRSKFGT
jgi:hypothetical protein